MPRKFMPVKAKQKQKVGGTNRLINTLSVCGGGETKSPDKSSAFKKRPRNGKD